MDDTKKKIAIVGMGIAGVSALREWTRQQEKYPAIEITAYGETTTFGRGVPYQQEDEILILNQPAGLATIIPEEPADFVNWLKETQGEKDPQDNYYSRALFGDYLTDRMETWYKKSSAQFVKEEIEKIEYLPNGQFRLYSASTIADFDVVNLCIGSAPFADPFHLNGQPRFILNPFPMNKQLARLPRGARVGVLGTGLTSMDILRYLDAYRPDLQLSFYSHSGRFKTIRGERINYKYHYFTPAMIEKEKAKNNGFIPLKTYFDWFKKECSIHGVEWPASWFQKEPFGAKDNIKKNMQEPHNIGVIQTLILGLDRMLTTMWMALTEADKNIFITEYGKFWDKVRSSFPKESGEILLDRWEKNRIQVFQDVIDIIPQEHSFKWVLKKQASQITDYVINAAGYDLKVDFETKENPLLRQLLNDRLLQPEPFGGVQVTVPNLSAISQRYGILNRLKVHGPLISGIQFGNNSIDIISEGVQTAVIDIVNQEFK